MKVNLGVGLSGVSRLIKKVDFLKFSRVKVYHVFEEQVVEEFFDVFASLPFLLVPHQLKSRLLSFPQDQTLLWGAHAHQLRLAYPFFLSQAAGTTPYHPEPRVSPKRISER